MDLKALAAALFVAFITVIMDAVFNFHYIYVLAILVITTYVLVRLLSIVASARKIPGKETPSHGTPIDFNSLIKTAAKNAGVSLEIEFPAKIHVAVNAELFMESLVDLFGLLDIKVHGQADQVRSGTQVLFHIILSVNRKTGSIQKSLDETIAAIRLQLLKTGGMVWQSDIPRKTEFHFLIPGQ